MSVTFRYNLNTETKVMFVFMSCCWYDIIVIINRCMASLLLLATVRHMWRMGEMPNLPIT